MPTEITVEAMNRVCSNIAPTLVGFLGTLPKFQQRVNAIYDEGLDYVSALKKFRDDKKKHPEPTTFPLFIFKRSVLRHSEHGIGRRAVNHNVIVSTESGFNTFKCVMGEIDVDFLLVTPDINELENFEIAYLSEVGQATEKKFSYEIPSIGRLDYFIKYDVLDDKTINIDSNFWKGVSGSATIRGFFFVATGTAARITEIDLVLRDLLTLTNFDSITITP